MEGKKVKGMSFAVDNDIGDRLSADQYQGLIFELEAAGESSITTSAADSRLDGARSSREAAEQQCCSQGPLCNAMLQRLGVQNWGIF